MSLGVFMFCYWRVLAINTLAAVWKCRASDESLMRSTVFRVERENE